MNFDRRSDVQYKMTLTATYADGTSDETSTTNSYKFTSEGTIEIGSCTLRVVHGVTESIDPETGKRGDRSFYNYFPELKVTVVNGILDELKTSFAPMTPLP
jgi:hypothetical protein